MSRTCRQIPAAFAPFTNCANCLRRRAVSVGAIRLCETVASKHNRERCAATAKRGPTFYFV